MARRASKRTKALDQSLLDHLANGLTLQQWCSGAARPSRSTVYRWMEEDEDFAGQVARARTRGCWSIEDEMVEVAENCPATTEDVAKAKLQLWMGEKRLVWLDGARYGTKQHIKHDVTHKVRQMTELERATRLKQLLAKAGVEVVEAPKQIEVTVHAPEEDTDE